MEDLNCASNDTNYFRYLRNAGAADGFSYICEAAVLAGLLTAEKVEKNNRKIRIKTLDYLRLLKVIKRVIFVVFKCFLVVSNCLVFCPLFSALWALLPETHK